MVIAIEDFLENCIRLQSKWYGIKKDQYYLKHYLSKHPKEMEAHIKEIDCYEEEVLKASFICERDKKSLLDLIRSYKDDLNSYRAASNPSNPNYSGYAFELLIFISFFCLGGFLTHLASEYKEKSETAKEKGLREGFAERLDKILKKHGVSL